MLLKIRIEQTIKTIFPFHPEEGIWNFLPEDTKKDRAYYEHILRKNGSAKINH